MTLRSATCLFACSLALCLTPPALAGNSNSLLDVSPDGKLLLAANADNASVTVVDTVAHKKLREIPVVKKLDVAPEPYGIVADRSGRRAWVTHEYPGLVSEVDLEAQKVVRQIKAGEFVRGIALGHDEKRLYVTEFYTGILRAIDLGKG